MMQTKRLVAFLLAMTMVLGLSGCGKKPPVETVPADTAAMEETQPAEATQVMEITEATEQTTEATLPVPETGGGEIQMGPEGESSAESSQDSDAPAPTEKAPEETQAPESPEWTPPKL